MVDYIIDTNRQKVFTSKKVLLNLLELPQEIIQEAIRREKVQMFSDLLSKVPDPQEYQVKFELVLSPEETVDSIARSYFQRPDGQWVFRGDFKTSEFCKNFVRDRVKTLIMTVRIKGLVTDIVSK